MRSPEALAPLRSVPAQRRVRRAGSEWREEKGDPGIHVPGTERKSLALTSRSSCPRPCALPQPPSTKDRHTHKPICRTSTFQGEREVKEKKKKSHYLYLSSPSGAAENANRGDSCCELFIFHSEDSVSFYCIQELLI